MLVQMEVAFFILIFQIRVLFKVSELFLVILADPSIICLQICALCPQLVSSNNLESKRLLCLVQFIAQFFALDLFCL